MERHLAAMIDIFEQSVKDKRFDQYTNEEIDMSRKIEEITLKVMKVKLAENIEDFGEDNAPKPIIHKPDDDPIRNVNILNPDLVPPPDTILAPPDTILASSDTILAPLDTIQTISSNESTLLPGVYDRKMQDAVDTLSSDNLNNLTTFVSTEPKKLSKMLKKSKPFWTKRH